MTQVNLFMKQKQIQSHSEHTYNCQGGGWGGRRWVQKEESKPLPTKRTRGQCKGWNSQPGGQEHLLRHKAGETGASKGTQDSAHGKWAKGSHLKVCLSDLVRCIF